MPFFLNKRKAELVELMDRDDCDPLQLQNTYRQFTVINKLLSRWDYLYKKEIKPLFVNQKTVSLLDIGFGGGDIPIRLAKLANRDGLDLQITAIETDDRAIEHVQELDIPDGIQFQKAFSNDLVKEGFSFDVVISNHVLHHLKDEEVQVILDDADQLATQKVLFGDIERSDLGFLLFSIIARILFWNSFIWYDGLISIRRSFTKPELQNLVPSGWKVERLFLYRLVLKRIK